MMRTFSGEAWSQSLTQKEIDILAEIWRKKTYTPWKLTFREVSTYVELCERIADYRVRAKRENARLRKHRSQEKMKAAAKQGVSSAIKRIKAIKTYNRNYMSKIRKEKRNDLTSK